MYVYFIAMGDNDQVLTEQRTEKILKNENVQKFLVQFIKTAEDAVPLLKEYISAIPEICLKLQEWIDDLAVQETAVNVVNTTTTTVGAVSTVLLFTPLAPFGIAGLVGSGIGAAATVAGDGIANHVKGKEIQKIADEKKELIDKAEKAVKELDALIKKVADHGKISYTKASTLCFGITGVAKASAGARVLLQGDKFARLMGLFRVWRAGQLAPGGLRAIRGVAGAGSKLLGGLGVVLGVWAVYDGWANGNPTKNATIETKTKFEEATKAIRQLIDLIEGQQNH